MLDSDRRHRAATLAAVQSRAARKLVAPYTVPVAEYQRRLAMVTWLSLLGGAARSRLP